MVSVSGLILLVFAREYWMGGNMNVSGLGGRPAYYFAYCLLLATRTVFLVQSREGR